MNYRRLLYLSTLGIGIPTIGYNILIYILG